MCKYASFVLTKDAIFWSKTTESHAEIIREFDLCESDSTNTRINIVKVEISPAVSWGNLAEWVYKVDQDVFPPWYDERDCEKRTRKELRKKVDKNLLANFKLLDEFLAEIQTTKWLKHHRKPLKEWHLSEGKTLAAAWDAARDAAGDAARDAALAAARAAAGDAAWAAARAAAVDAARAAEMIICTGLKIDPKHIKHINARWEVWRRGYALLCDVNGKLFVYGVKK